MPTKKKIIYIHDFPFLVSKENLYFSVGMPERYFERFTDLSDNIHVEILSRTHELYSDCIPSGWSKNKNPKISVIDIIKTYRDNLNFKNFLNIIRILKSADLIVINYPSVNGLFYGIILIVMRKKIALEISCDEHVFDTKLNSSLAINLLRYIVKTTGKLLVKYSSGALYVAKYLINTFGGSKISTIASNVMIDKVVNNARAIPNVDQANLLFVGGVSRRKGFDLVQKSVIALNKEGMSLNLHVAGPLVDVEHDPSVSHYHGVLDQSDLYNLYNKSHILILPSFSEGLPRVAIEAMSTGLPVVGANTPAFHEIIDINCTIEPGNVEQMKSIIRRLCRSKEEYLKQSVRNQQKALEFLDTELQVKRLKHYEKIIS